MPWGNSVFPLLIITPTGGFTGLFLYSPGPGTGNLIGSWTAQAGTDPFGNAFPMGINVTSGVLSGVTISALAETMNPGPFILDAVSGLTVAVFTATGVNNWTAPAAVTSVDVWCWGAGGGGDGLDAGGGEGGGGGAAFSRVTNVVVTPANVYHPTVGIGGAANTAGGNTTFAGDAVTVTANGGGGAVDPGSGPGGAASTTPAGVISLPGGVGGTGNQQTPRGGGGGGSAASDLSPGNAGQTSTGSPGGAGGVAPAGSLFGTGAGGNGGAAGSPGVNGVQPGGGGGGGGSGAAGTGGGTGGNGRVILIYSTGTVHTNIVLSATSGTDPVTGTPYSPGITTFDPVFADTTRIFGANVTVGASPVWNLNGASLDVTTVGSGLRVAEGSNAKQGVATLVGGTITVANTSVTANSRIHVTGQPGGANRGGLNVTTITAATSFVVTSTNAADTGNFAYEIFEPG